MRPLPSVMLAVAAALVVSGSAFAQSSETGPNAVDRGKALAVRNCSGCHAVELEGESPNPKAPPFRTLSERFPIDALEETFIGTIDTGHPGMPVFVATQEQIDDIIAYIATVMQ
ncbi:MAG TPA: cytochrome c [Aurantimonas coralicida]|uniref:Cytochrome c n=2 Tax=root TaxID=1 RepID=A0A9C9NCG7_9HYPH|nr:cytochrome c [Aurantimonas coralicida]HET98813.1 cytochrome c [Aurantimonas coralicida]